MILFIVVLFYLRLLVITLGIYYAFSILNTEVGAAYLVCSGDDFLIFNYIANELRLSFSINLMVFTSGIVA